MKNLHSYAKRKKKENAKQQSNAKQTVLVCFQQTCHGVQQHTAQKHTIKKNVPAIQNWVITNGGACPLSGLSNRVNVVLKLV
jgi:hypothetical protein